VRDTGIGISPENQSIIFNRFRQAQHNGRKHQGGTGLGLAISQHIVGLLGGKIWVESIQGEGSAFYFTIPYNPVNDSPDGSGKLSDRPLSFDWSDKTMLIVEEMDSNFNYLGAALSRTGLNLLRATDAISGIKLCLSNDAIDLVFLDINAHDLKGLNIISEIKKHKPSLPVIAQIAKDLLDEDNRGEIQGYDDYISKPVKFNILMNMLAKYLDKKK
jgi:CheY-like chemotaxis protein